MYLMPIVFTINGVIEATNIQFFPSQERASQIKTFIYVKIPQCAVCVNYKVRMG